MSSMKAGSEFLSLRTNGGGGGGGRSSILNAFPLLPSHFGRPRTLNILIVKASAKRASSKRKTRHLQGRSIEAPSNVVKEVKETEFRKGIDTQGAIASPDEDMSSETESASSVTTSDASVSSKREVVLKACVMTCAAIFMVGVLIQKATHLAAESGWSVPDSTLLVNFDVEAWHFKVILALVFTVSLSRQLLLLAWPEFSDSSDTANKEVLGPLQSTDYAIVAILPAISEELLFRGALLPLCGFDWKGTIITGLLFGVLHLTGGRKNAFAIWASVVGVLYGLACVYTGSVLVPMVAHATNNLVGATLWRLKQEQGSSHS